MVERVGRGRIIVPAAAALGAVSAGMLAAGPSLAAGRDATLQMRVQVVEACQIRVLPAGRLEQSCGGGDRGARPQLSMGELIDGFRDRAGRQLGRLEASVWPGGLDAPMTVSVQPVDRRESANRRAGAIAADIAQRVRFITLTY
jgi:hypothetical protein